MGRWAMYRRRGSSGENNVGLFVSHVIRQTQFEIEWVFAGEVSISPNPGLATGMLVDGQQPNETTQGTSTSLIGTYDGPFDPGAAWVIDQQPDDVNEVIAFPQSGVVVEP